MPHKFKYLILTLDNVWLTYKTSYYCIYHLISLNLVLCNCARGKIGNFSSIPTKQSIAFSFSPPLSSLVPIITLQCFQTKKKKQEGTTIIILQYQSLNFSLPWANKKSLCCRDKNMIECTPICLIYYSHILIRSPHPLLRKKTEKTITYST